MDGFTSPIRFEWWACCPRAGGEWFAEYALSFFGKPILALSHIVVGPFRTAHGACCECERQMRDKRAAALGFTNTKKSIFY